MIPVVLGISFVVYAIISFTPGNPAQLILGADTDPGMGSILVNSVRIKDTPIIVSSIILVAVFIGICNLLVDIVYAYNDPRIKAQYFSVASKRGKAKTKTGGTVA